MYNYVCPKKNRANIGEYIMIRRIFNKLVEARAESARRKIARMQLHKMTDRELQDVGIVRCDIERVILTGKAL